MANALKGKTLTTWTIILPNEEVAKDFMESASGHFEFMQEKSYQNGPLKLVQYVVSSGPEWKEYNSFLDGKMPEKTGKVVTLLKFMKPKMVCINIGSNRRTSTCLLITG